MGFLSVRKMDICLFKTKYLGVGNVVTNVGGFVTLKTWRQMYFLTSRMYFVTFGRVATVFLEHVPWTTWKTINVSPYNKKNRSNIHQFWSIQIFFIQLDLNFYNFSKSCHWLFEWVIDDMTVMRELASPWKIWSQTKCSIMRLISVMR